ncbi:Unannotated [Lentimonas sp. CC19]|nr:Unannotated [Lentimonas sp. CC10]CAA6695354.1 Unannotated [Lentimonas sp. CC19]CAA7068816.1 Unannotated [Lentimonas sp. CC11]
MTKMWKSIYRCQAACSIRFNSRLRASKQNRHRSPSAWRFFVGDTGWDVLRPVCSVVVRLDAPSSADGTEAVPSSMKLRQEFLCHL